MIQRVIYDNQLRENEEKIAVCLVQLISIKSFVNENISHRSWGASEVMNFYKLS